MLHEIFLSLSGHPSPLFAPGSKATMILSPPEQELLSSIAHLSELHYNLLLHTSKIISTHASTICRAVATSIKLTHLSRFQQKIIDVESGILEKDAGSVGAYNIVPLTAIVGQFSGWTRRMEWFWQITQFMMKDDCTGAKLIDNLCDSVQTGYSDIEDVALHLAQVAEVAWVKQASSWILFGRLPSIGGEDFFLHEIQNEHAQEYLIKHELLPRFVTTSTAASILFVGRSLNHILVRGMVASDCSIGFQSAHLSSLSSLSFPITSSDFSNVISAIRLSLSQTTLQKLLPMSRILEVLSLLYDYFLLGRGEFAIALISEADEKIRSRWRRSDNLAYDRQDNLSDVVVKDGEVSAVLSRTWAAMAALQSANDDDDDQLELARDLIHLSLSKGAFLETPEKHPLSESCQPSKPIVSTPFRSFLLSTPAELTLRIPSPLDLFLAPAEVQTYSIINAYLLSIRRAHLHLTDLWKISSLRRHHPAPPPPPYGSSAAGRTVVKKFRLRAKVREKKLRSVWATSSAALFLLGEMETYLQGEVVQGTWAGFQQWLTGSICKSASGKSDGLHRDALKTAEATRHSHDWQALSDSHRKYLDSLTHNLLLRNSAFTDSLNHLLRRIDQLVALVNRIHSIWQSLDLENDEGVVDAFTDFRKEEKDIGEQLDVAAGHVKEAIELLTQNLRDVDQEKENVYNTVPDSIHDGMTYSPLKAGRVDRLLMKLDFGGWFNVSKRADESDEHDSKFDEM